MAVRTFISRISNIFLVILSVCIGLLMPGPGKYLSWLVIPIVTFLVYSSFREISLDDVDYYSYPLFILFAVVISYTFIPYIGTLLGQTVLSHDALIGIAIILAAPTTAGSAIIWTRFSNGDSQLTAIISICTILSAPIITPLILSILLSENVAVPVRSILSDLLIIVVGSVFLVVSLPNDRISEQAIDRGSMFSIFVLIYIGVTNVNVALVNATDIGSIGIISVIMFGLTYSGLSIVGSLIGFKYYTLRSLVFSSSFKNLGIGLAIALPFRSTMIIVAVVTYYVSQQAIGAAVSDYL